MKRTSCWIFLWLCLASTPMRAQDDTLQVMYYNLLNFPTSLPQRVDNLRDVLKVVQPDVLVVNELVNLGGANAILNQALNINGANHYKRASFVNGLDTDNMLYYDSRKMELFSEDTIETALRLINAYRMILLDPGLALHQDTTFVEFFSLHLKASQGSTNQQKRLAECQELMDYLNGSTNWTNLVVGGDFNIYTSSEPAFQLLTNNGGNELSDPINTPGSWHSNATYAGVHTQSTRTTQVGGGSTGGVDDRFDMMLVSGDMLNGANALTYIPGSYEAFGNDGQHFNIGLTDPPSHPSLPDTLIADLYDMSDHLPIIMQLAVDYPDTPNCQPIATVFSDRLGISTVRLNWAPVVGATHYQLRGRPAGGGGFTHITVPPLPTEFTATGLTNNTDYEWQVRAFCDVSENVNSGWSPLDTFLTDCPAPDSHWTSGITANAATLNWPIVYGSVGYEVRGRESGSAGWVNLLIPGKNQLAFAGTGLAPATTYEWQVRSVCDVLGINRSDYTSLVSFTTGGSKAVMVGERLTLFPNPARHQVTIQVGFAPQSIEVRSLHGRLLHRQKWSGYSSSATIATVDWSSGWYDLRLVYPSRVVRTSFQVTH